MREQRMLYANNFAHSLRCCLSSQLPSLRADHDRRNILRGREAQCGIKRLPTRALDLAIALFQHKKDTHSTRASVFSFSTRAAAASLAEPRKICVDFCLIGAEICSSVTTDVLSTPSSAAFTVRSSFVLARLIPISVA